MDKIESKQRNREIEMLTSQYCTHDTATRKLDYSAIHQRTTYNTREREREREEFAIENNLSEKGRFVLTGSGMGSHFGRANCSIRTILRQ
jgi:hypothetical protein